MADPTMVCVRFSPDDLEVLEALEAFERLKRSDVVRRAVRAYAKQIGVEVSPKPKPKR